MKIIHLVSNKSWGGGEQYVLDLAREQRRQGHEVAIVARRVEAVAGRFADEGFPVVTMPLKGTIDIISPLQLSRCIAKVGNAVIHVHNFKDAIVATRARSLSGNTGIRIILTRHLVKPAKRSRHYTSLYRQIDAMVFVSHLAMDEFLSSRPDIDTDRMTVIHNGVTIPDISTVPNAVKGTLTLMYHGRISSEKGIDTLINALALVKELPLRVVIAGTGKPEYVATLRRQAALAGVDGIIEWAGHVDDIHPLIATADIGIAPSRARESFGLAPVEYMAHGKPVITTSNGAQREYITDGVDGLLVAPDSPEEIAGAIKHLATNPDVRERIGTAARATAIERLSFERFYREIMTVYKKLL